MLTRVGLRPAHLHAASLATLAAALGLWARAKAVDQHERGNAERGAIFVGLWPAMLWRLGDSLTER
ncbi:MAG: hypothetical protein ACT4PP_06220 [Sporichthyaceae bacterium]